jgi:hypothetical protein
LFLACSQTLIRREATIKAIDFYLEDIKERLLDFFNLSLITTSFGKVG